MTKRTCCFLNPQQSPLPPRQCTNPAEWELRPEGAIYETVDACTDHVGALLDDAPETRVTPIKQS